MICLILTVIMVLCLCSALFSTGIYGNHGGGGEAGADGADGADGAAGAAGADGAAGAQGIQGVPGETGAAGAKGDQGIQGIQGVEGEEGEDAGFTWEEFEVDYEDFVARGGYEYFLPLVEAGTQLLVMGAYIRHTTQWETSGVAYIDLDLGTEANSILICNYLRVSAGVDEATCVWCAAPVVVLASENLVLKCVSDALLEDLTAGVAKVGIMYREVW